jgi:hypothetical protein
VATGTPSEVVGRRATLLVRGRTSGPAVPIGKGRVRRALGGAIVEGPAELLEKSDEALEVSGLPRGEEEEGS